MPPSECDCCHGRKAVKVLHSYIMLYIYTYVYIYLSIHIHFLPWVRSVDGMLFLVLFSPVFCGESQAMSLWMWPQCLCNATTAVSIQISHCLTTHSSCSLLVLARFSEQLEAVVPRPRNFPLICHICKGSWLESCGRFGWFETFWQKPGWSGCRCWEQAWDAVRCNKDMMLGGKLERESGASLRSWFIPVIAAHWTSALFSRMAQSPMSAIVKCLLGVDGTQRHWELLLNCTLVLLILYSILIDLLCIILQPLFFFFFQCGFVEVF